MRILLYSRVFLPSIGGSEEVVRLLAEQFTLFGHEVTIATETQSLDPDDYLYNVVRKADFRSLMRLAHWADVCLMIGPSLRALPALLAARCPIVISHHIYVDEIDKRNSILAIISYLKISLRRAICSKVTNIYPTFGLRRMVGNHGYIIRNPFDIGRFLTEKKVWDRDIVFVGRMIPEKGCGDLIDAVSLLGAGGAQVSVTLIGEGAERSALERKVYERDLGHMIHFAGQLTGGELARMVSRHRLMVVPSRCAEAFGIVALEGMASGCVVIGADVGGLPEAIGPGGIVVPAGNPEAIANAVSALLADEDLCGVYRRAGASFAARHAPREVAQDYLEVLRDVGRPLRPGCEAQEVGICVLSQDGQNSSTKSGDVC